HRLARRRALGLPLPAARVRAPGRRARDCCARRARRAAAAAGPRAALVGASPWPFFGAELIRGSELADARLTEDDRCALGRPLGEFLRALHDARVEVDLPEDPNARADMAKRAAMAETALE